MIGIATTRGMMAKRHPPPAILALFYLMARVAAVLARQGMAANKAPGILHLPGFSAIMALVVAPIIDLEHLRPDLVTPAGSIR